jgi:hypothetical protein
MSGMSIVCKILLSERPPYRAAHVYVYVSFYGRAHTKGNNGNAMLDAVLDDDSYCISSVDVEVTTPSEATVR